MQNKQFQWIRRSDFYGFNRVNGKVRETVLFDSVALTYRESLFIFYKRLIEFTRKSKSVKMNDNTGKEWDKRVVQSQNICIYRHT